MKKIGKYYSGTLRMLSYLKDSFITYHTRPRVAKDVKTQPVLSDINKRVAIVIQGKLMSKYNFTLESVRLYKRLYPDSKIIVSTWSNEPSEQIVALKKEGVEVILNDIPNPLTGFCNNNLQRISSINGILKAKELGVEYVLKCRTDQRFYERDIFNFLIRLQKIFPLRLSCEAKERIITFSLGTFSTRMYNWSDMFTFGTLNDVERYYSCPNDDSEHGKKLEFSDTKELCMHRPGEIYFTSHYIESLGFDLMWTFEDSDYYMRELAIVIDSDMIDLFWPKYNRRENVWRRYDDFHLKPVYFKDWLCMQQNI